MNIVVNELQQKPHDISKNKSGNQVPVDDVSQTSNAPEKHRQKEMLKA